MTSEVILDAMEADFAILGVSAVVLGPHRFWARFAGSDRQIVGNHSWCCDHLEEQLSCFALAELNPRMQKSSHPFAFMADLCILLEVTIFQAIAGANNENEVRISDR